MKVTAKEAIDYSSISNINRLIYIDWYWLISILIDYRFHRLTTPGYMHLLFLARLPKTMHSTISILFHAWKIEKIVISITCLIFNKISNVKPVLNVAFYVRRMHSKQWIMRHFSWLSIVLNAFGTCKMRRLEQAW
jgi:hypothetical protein